MLAEMRLGICHHEIQKSGEVVKQALHSFSFETGGMAQSNMNLISTAEGKLKAGIKNRTLNIQFDWVKIETAEFHLRQRILVKQHGCLEEGIAAEVPMRAQRFNQSSERHILM